MPYTAFDRFVARCRFRAARACLRRGSRVCDVGCGHEMGFLQFARDDVQWGVGVDNQISSGVRFPFPFVQADILCSLPFHSDTFDHVVMLAVLEHLARPADALRETFRVLKPGGSLILTWPSAAVDTILFFTRAVGLTSPEMQSEEHVARLSVGDLQALLRDIGFRRFTHRTFECGLNNLMVAEK